MVDFKNIDLNRLPNETLVLTFLYLICKAGIVRFDMNNTEHRSILKHIIKWINRKNNELVNKGATTCSNRLLISLIYYNIMQFMIPAKKND